MVGYVVLWHRVNTGHSRENQLSYMKPALIEENMMLLMILLQQLARLLRALRPQPFHVELRLL